MSNFDFTPLARTTIGFDRLMDMVDSALRVDNMSDSYPPYNIEQIGENYYRITIAVAGFSEDDLDITVQDNTLKISGRSRMETEGVTYLYRGIAGRAFKKHFQLADFIKIGEARLENGLLSVELIREIPESMKPRAIKINSSANSSRLIEQHK